MHRLGEMFFFNVFCIWGKWVSIIRMEPAKTQTEMFLYNNNSTIIFFHHQLFTQKRNDRTLLLSVSLHLRLEDRWAMKNPTYEFS
jgi:hypothetical protein